MKLIVIGVLLFLGYRLVMQKTEVDNLKDIDRNDLKEGEFTEYEEVD